MVGARGRREAPAHIMVPRLILLLSVLALMLVGFVMIYSTSSVIELSTAKSVAEADPMADVVKQMLFAAVGTVLRGGRVEVRSGVCVARQPGVGGVRRCVRAACGHLVLGRGRR